MYGYVYKTTFLKENKIYVGQHKSEQLDNKYYGSGVIIKRLLEKYPLKDFTCEILCECETADELNKQEIYWIDKLNARNNAIGYNIASGGAFGDSGYHLGMLGKHQSDNQKEAARKANSYKRNDEIRHNMSVGQKGKPHKASELFKNGAFRGKHHSEATKKILSQKAKEITINYHKNLSEQDKIKRGNNISKSKSGTICITDGNKNYFIQPSDWYKYEDKGYFKMSLYKYNKLMNK